MRIVFFSLPFRGHFDVLHEFARRVAARREGEARPHEVVFVTCGWESVPPPPVAGLRSRALAISEAPPSAPTDFTWPRVRGLADAALAICWAAPTDFVVYDFFCLEGYIASQVLRIPCACSIPAVFARESAEARAFLDSALRGHAADIAALEEKYGVELRAKMAPLSDGFLVPGDINLLWVDRAFYAGMEDVLPPNSHFLSVLPPAPPPEPGSRLLESAGHTGAVESVYVCLGTVVTGNLWDRNPSVRAYLSALYEAIVGELAGAAPARVVLAVPGHTEAARAVQGAAPNVTVVDFADQAALIAAASLVIFHGGGNTLAQVLSAGVPSVVIPFFGDQHATARRVRELGIGTAAYLAEKDGVDTRRDFGLRPLGEATAALRAVLADFAGFERRARAFAQRRGNPSAAAFDFPPLLRWREGDLLFGSSADRRELAKILGLEPIFQIGNMAPFSRWGAEPMPRIVDQYNDALRDPAVAEEEIHNARYPRYGAWLGEYRAFLLGHPEYLRPLGRIPGSGGGEEATATIQNMCLGGLEFFLGKKKVHVHFTVQSFPAVSAATLMELEWLRRHPEVADQVHFCAPEKGGGGDGSEERAPVRLRVLEFSDVMNRVVTSQAACGPRGRRRPRSAPFSNGCSASSATGRRSRSAAPLRFPSSSRAGSRHRRARTRRSRGAAASLTIYWVSASSTPGRGACVCWPTRPRRYPSSTLPRARSGSATKSSTSAVGRRTPRSRFNSGPPSSTAPSRMSTTASTSPGEK
jgi:hypothetical protein